MLCCVVVPRNHGYQLATARKVVHMGNAGGGFENLSDHQLAACGRWAVEISPVKCLTALGLSAMQLFLCYVSWLEGNRECESLSSGEWAMEVVLCNVPILAGFGPCNSFCRLPLFLSAKSVQFVLCTASTQFHPSAVSLL